MGIFVLLVGAGLGVFGLMQHLKGKRILAAPFLKTGDVAKPGAPAGDKGAVSTEGALVAEGADATVTSPITKTKCLAYEIEVYRHHEKTVQTQDGAKTEKGKNKIKTIQGGAVIQLNDGSGVVQVDVKDGKADFDNWKKVYDEKSSHLTFEGYTITADGSGDGYTTGYSAVEKVVPLDTSKNLFVLGKLEGGKIIKPSWRSLMISNKGREGLMGSTAKKTKVGFIGGGVGAVGGIAMLALGIGNVDTSNIDSKYCKSEITGALAKACEANVGTEDTYAWTIEKPGKYNVFVIPAPGKKYALWPELEIKQDGKTLSTIKGSVGEAATASLDLKAGKYEIDVRPADAAVQGGFDYTLNISSNVPGATPMPKTPAVAAGKDTKDTKDTKAADEKVAEDQK
ncbi:MAG: GIDE domain-containing protein [Myxococcaceae bacterium]